MGVSGELGIMGWIIMQCWPDKEKSETRYKTGSSNCIEPKDLDVPALSHSVYLSVQIVLPPHLERIREKLAENIHELWAITRIEQGWTYGTVSIQWTLQYSNSTDDQVGLHPVQMIWSLSVETWFVSTLQAVLAELWGCSISLESAVSQVMVLFCVIKSILDTMTSV